MSKALTESPEDFKRTSFSEYVSGNDFELSDRFRTLAEGHGLDGLEAALNEFDRLVTTKDKVRLQYALMIFLADSQEFSDYGLRIPSLESRSSWKTLPSRKIDSQDDNK